MEREVAAVRGEDDLSIMKFRYENIPTVVVPPLVQRAAFEIEKEERGP